MDTLKTLEDALREAAVEWGEESLCARIWEDNTFTISVSSGGYNFHSGSGDTLKAAYDAACAKRKVETAKAAIEAQVRAEVEARLQRVAA